MSDRPQGVRTGVRPDGAPGADGTPGTGPAVGATAAGASPAGAAPAGPPGGPSLAEPTTGEIPTQGPGTSPGRVPADGTAPPSPGDTQVVPLSAVPPPTQGGAARPGQQAGRPAQSRGTRGPRRARLQLRHVDTWSALKISLVLSIALFFIWMVAVGLLYGVLAGLGVFDTLNDLFGQIGTASDDGGSQAITPGVVFGGAAVIGAINIVLITALCTVAAFIYNLCADLVGGLEVTLAERD